MTIKKIISVVFGDDKEINDRGNSIQRGFYPSGRYVVDFAEDYKDEGWQQFDTDQDAHYFGTWVNSKKFQNLAYCEGDWSLVTCEDVEHYNAEIKSMIDFYSEGRIARVINDNGVTDFRQDRKKFFIQ